MGLENLAERGNSACGKTVVLVYKCRQKKLNSLYYKKKSKGDVQHGEKSKIVYSEFKQQIVDLYNAGGTSYPQLEHEYGVSKSTLSTWVKQLSPIKISEEQTVTLKEYKALQKENQRLRLRMRY